MSTLTIMRGYPASGKTTLAKKWVAEKQTDNVPRARVSRDDLRETLFAGRGVLDYAQEEHITAIQQDTVRKLLKRGYDVVVDDLNLRRKYAVAWADVAKQQGADFEVWDVETNVDTCVRRDFGRRLRGERIVGMDVIRDIAAKFPIGRWPEITASEPKPTTLEGARAYVPDVGKPPVYIVDLDGTVALKDRAAGARGWHEYDRVGEDLPNEPVIDLVARLRATGAGIVFLSGRKESCRDQTRKWLIHHMEWWTINAPLFMRTDGDNRDDSIVKLEIFDTHIRDQYQVLGCIDDRDRVVAMWRSLGLTCFQVAPGDF